jgi:CheY-like chemotaxis protein
MEMGVLLLVVEDEPLILLGIQDALEAGGYTVLTAANGEEALELLTSRTDEISGLITDIRLGSGPDGWQVARHAREVKPNMAIVYATGDSAHEWASQGVPKSLLMQKPYAAAQAVSAISTLLTEADSNSAA